jgi:NADP-dependent 3-hydroxy acid dehydrogenase YdfG
MTSPLRGQLALVTGASRGIGAPTASALAAAGARVVRVARSSLAPLDGAIDIAADLADAASRQAALERMLAEAGVPDLVVSNAGAFLLAALDETSDALLREQLAINLEAPFAIARQLLPSMRARGTGRHVLVGSVADLKAFPGNAAYSASKFAARGLHEVLVEEYRGSGVQCTLVSPGPTDTAVWDPIDPDSKPGFPSRRNMLRPEDIAAAIVWVAQQPAHVHVESIRLSPG